MKPTIKQRIIDAVETLKDDTDVPAGLLPGLLLLGALLPWWLGVLLSLAYAAALSWDRGQ